MKRSIAIKTMTLGVGAALAGAVAIAAPTATAASTGAFGTGTSASLCHYLWGSLPETDATMAAGPLTNIRSGRHTCFDRLVFDLRGKPSGYTVRYVARLEHPGSGTTVPVRGGAKIQVTINAPAYDKDGHVVYQPKNPNEVVNVTGYSALRQVVWMGSYEGYSDVGIGVRARTPFRVFTLTDASASRVVIDIAHNW